MFFGVCLIGNGLCETTSNWTAASRPRSSSETTGEGDTMLQSLPNRHRYLQQRSAVVWRCWAWASRIISRSLSTSRSKFENGQGQFKVNSRSTKFYPIPELICAFQLLSLGGACIPRAVTKMLLEGFDLWIFYNLDRFNICLLYTSDAADE